MTSGFRTNGLLLKMKASSQPVSMLSRVFVPLVVMAGSFWMLKHHAGLPGLPEVISLISQVTLANWIIAVAATVLSFWSLGRYDAVAHRHLQTGINSTLASRSGMASIAFSQSVGFGLVSGAFARWRLLPALSAVQAAQLTGFVGITFLTALAAICGLSLLLVATTLSLQMLGLGILTATAATCVFCFLYPEWHIKSLRLRLPSLKAIGALGLWTLMDISFAGIALWVLLPADSGVSLMALLPAFFLALGLAIISSSPGGAGPLELGMLTLLPQVDAAHLVAGLIAFRAVYYILPALVSSACLFWPRLMCVGLRAEADEFALMGSDLRPAASQSFDRPQAETGVLLQNGGQIMAFGLNQIALLETPQISTMLFDPISGQRSEIPAALARHASARNSAACLYKCGPRMALAARAQGWKVLRIAKDAILLPETFSDSGSGFRQLRRKLRNAQKAGVQVETAWSTLPLHEMARIDRAWSARHGGARGTTMGQFEPSYVSIQMTFLAWQDAAPDSDAGRKAERTLVGFVTFHRTAHEWCLDLVRIQPGAPDGTGHALIRAAIDAAAEAGIRRLSLCAVPDHALSDRMGSGLMQFKSCFAPTWEPRYIAAPTWPQMALSILELARVILRPAPVAQLEDQPQMAPAAMEMHETHIDVEENAFVLSRSA